MTTAKLFLSKLAVPRDRAEALEAYAQLMDAHWSEGAGDYIRQTEKRSYGLILNSLAYSVANDYGDFRRDLVAAAKAALTSEDREFLYRGG